MQRRPLHGLRLAVGPVLLGARLWARLWAPGTTRAGELCYRNHTTNVTPILLPPQHLAMPSAKTITQTSSLFLSVAFLVISCLISSSACADPIEQNRPNIVFIMADDCTFRDLGCYGGQAATPHLDTLASEGMKFANCFQAAPMCSPTRHNLYTGLYPVKSGAYPNHTFASDDVKSIVHYLQPLGYRVALSGKTHISPKSVFPFEYSSKNKNPDIDAINALMSESAESKTPFCVFACSNEPHSPWDKGDASRYPPAKVKLPPYIIDTPEVRSDFSNYLAEITYYDAQVGEILKSLEKYDLVDNTLVMVVSEQGNGFPFAKWTCYDNGLQSAMIVRWPGRVPEGVVTNATVEYVDVLPTFVQAAGGQPASVLDGRSFLPVLSGETDQHKEYTYGIMTTRGIINGSDAYPIRSIRSSRYRLILNLNYESKFTNAITRGKVHDSFVRAARTDPEASRLVQLYSYRPAVELFDVVADPLNMTNLADDPSHKLVIADLRSRLESWMKDQGDDGLATELKAKDHQHQSKRRKKSK